jgi:IS605 OrfB family transposase
LIVKNDQVFLHLVVSKETTDPVPNGKVVGMDAGIKRTAVTSSNGFFGGGRLSHVSAKFKRIRRSLQKKGHSGKRHLVRIKNKENRFVRDMLHCVSKKIVAGLRPGDSIAMEELKGIRERCKFGKKVRTMLNGWAFSQLQWMVSYKASLKGCVVLRIDPRNTSRTCSACGHCEKKNRKSQSLFACEQCQKSLNADLNASRNIARKGEIMLAKRQHDGLKSTSLMLPVV